MFFGGTNIPLKRLKAFNNLIKSEKGCWLFTNVHRGGYGIFKVNNKQWRAHRLAWRLIKGEIPKELYVLHKCDVKNCVNPKHLFLGNANDNLKDCMGKGRFRVASGKNHGTKTHPERIARGERHGSKTHPEKWVKGESIPWSKLTEKIVRKIRKEYKPGIFGTERLAKKYGISQRATYCVVSRKTWKHVS